MPLEKKYECVRCGKLCYGYRCKDCYMQKTGTRVTVMRRRHSVRMEKNGQ